MSSSGSQEQARDRLTPLQSVVTDSVHEHSRIAFARSRSSLDNPQPDSIEFQRFSQRQDNFRDAYGPPNDKFTKGMSNTTAPASFGVSDSPDIRRRHEEAEAERERSEQLKSAQVQLEQQRRVLSRLKAWHDWDENRHKSLRNFLLSKIGYPRRPSRPNDSELIQLALYFFPPRAKLKVILCDYGDNYFERSEVMLGEIETKNVWFEKPPWAEVRWIHVPIGPGLLASSLEDMFMYERPLLSQKIGSNRPQFTYSCEISSLRERRYLQDQVDVFNILRDIPELNQRLSSVNWMEHQKSKLYRDILWRAEHLGRSCDFWDFARSDMPWQLTEGIRSDLDELDMHQIPEFENQMLSQHGVYSKAVLVRDSFRCFGRADDFLLTMSSSKGINYLNQDLTEAFGIPCDAGIYDSNYHYLEYVRRQWSGDAEKAAGTTAWPTPSVDYILAYIMTKLQRTPTHSRRGKAVPDIQSAYIPIVSELKRRRGSQFKRHESVKLVREYVTCMNEISQIYEISEQKIRYLEQLLDQWQHYERQAIDKYEMVPMKEGDMGRIIEATMSYIKDNHKHLPRLLNDLKSSLDVLFQLRTIEQNELAIIAESNNKAILVFTVVTIIFLPLSFFTSYFGMNLRGIADTDRTERYFWAVCGSVTIFVVSLTVLFGFKNRLHAWIWEDREFAKGRAKGRRL